MTAITDHAHSPTHAPSLAEENSGTLGNRISKWIRDHKKEILVALLIIGVAIATLGLGLAVGAAASASLFTGKMIGGYIVTQMTTAGSLVIGGLVTTTVGVALAGVSAGALSTLPDTVSPEGQRT